ncbi:hypothetical protein IBTHAUMO2_460005 [Nitrosopumilaceae archaeon]|nr:hypothetical protein [Nitrosopumilus sp.]CAI9831882.1 hypothetical protein IBTHAUMO2_460005 [Nitrosopumilaceae archaeon]MDA7942108.1 hypothetical protein [Nitrosopumilus sp.]MDA7944040.1 hypothetical protein [Nitrosopumilus sp.]MDA7945739.1 hypothetical protein [Nitrosopumilus sp.]
MALRLEADEARRHMYLLLRAPDQLIDSEKIPRAERIHEALFVFKSTLRLPPGDLVIKKDGCHSPSLDLALKYAVESGGVRREEVGGVGRYWLTERGLAESRGPWDAAEQDERIEAVEAKYQVNDITDEELVSFLYAEFPETWTDPQVRAEAMEWGLEAACSMYDRAKVSLTTGSWMAGISYGEFMEAFAVSGYVTFKGTAEDIQRDLKAIDGTG